MKQHLVIALMTISLLLSGGFIIKNQIDKTKQEKVTSVLNKELMQAKLEIGRAETKFGNASTHMKTLEKDLKTEIEERNSLITRYGYLKARYSVLVKQKTNIHIETTNTIDLANCDTIKLEEGQLYVAKDQKLSALDTFTGGYNDTRITINCTVTPRIDSSSGTLPMDIHYKLNLKLKAEIVETITPSGAINNYINLYEVDKHNRVIGKFEITKFQMVIDDQRQPRFLWWDPHVDIGLGLGLKLNSKIDDLEWEGGASIGFTPVSYGLSSTDLAWRFGRFSFDIGSEISVGFTPFIYNVGGHLPVFNNLWLGGFARYGLSSEEWSMGLVLGATL